MADRHRIQCDLNLAALGRAQLHILNDQRLSKGMGHGGFDLLHGLSPLHVHGQADPECGVDASMDATLYAADDATSARLGRSMKMNNAKSISPAASKKGAPGR